MYLLQKIQDLPRFLWSESENKNSQKKAVLRKRKSRLTLDCRWKPSVSQCVCPGAMEQVTGTADVTSYCHISPLWPRCVCWAFQTPLSWKRRDLEASAFHCAVGILQQPEELLGSAGRTGISMHRYPQAPGVPRVSISFSFWLSQHMLAEAV